jgi:hypothetical protein
LDNPEKGFRAQDPKKGARLSLLCGLCLVSGLIYWKVLCGYFLGDDLDFLYYVAKWTHEGLLAPKLLGEFIAPQNRGGFFYRPLAMVSYAIDYLIWGTNPMGWHLTNLSLHIANVALLWNLVVIIAKRSGCRTPLVVGMGAALLFALRPSFPETVAWISGRPDELALLGLLLSLLIYLRANGEWGKGYLLALGGFLLALASKEVGVTLPGGLMALHIARAIVVKPKGEEPSWRAWIRQTTTGIGPFVLVLIAYFIGRTLLFGTPFKIYQTTPLINITDPAWYGAKLFALRFFLAQSLNLTSLAKLFLLFTTLEMVVGFVLAWRSSSGRCIWVFGACWLMTQILPLAQYLLIVSTGEGARILYIPGAALAVLIAAPLASISLSRESRGEKTLSQPLALAGGLFTIALVFLSFPLQGELLRPWILAGQSMKRLPAAVAARADELPANGFALLIVPDHVDGALFGRNGQGSLMEPPVQAKSLDNRVLVMTVAPPHHAPVFEMTTSPLRRLEYWCWNLRGQRFERVWIRPHRTDQWLEAWKSSLRDSGWFDLAHEMGE